MKYLEEFSSDKLGYHQDRVMELLEGKDVFPITLEMDITNACNYNCPWCSERSYRSVFPEATLPWQLATRVIKDMKHCGIRSITLEGGEPTMHPKFSHIALADVYDIDIGLITNGSRLRTLPDDVFKRLSYIRVSLDAGDPESYAMVHGVDKIRFPEVLGNLAMAVRKKGPRTTIGVSYVVSDHTRCGMVRAAKIVRDTGADYIQFKPLLCSDWRFKYFDMGTMLDEVRALDEPVDGGFRVYLSRFSPAELGNPVGVRNYKFCRAHRLIGAISATGDVQLCGNLKHKFPDGRYVFGNLREKPFAEIWHSERRHEISRVVESDRSFLKNVCMYCRMNEFNETLENGVEHGRLNKTWRFI